MGDNIKQRNIAEYCEEVVKIFGANKNLYRIAIRAQDGLKPVQGRFLYSLYKGKGRHNFVKMAKAAADTVADFHPHGDASVTDVGASMASTIFNNINLVEGQGNFGSYKNEKAGASRYIECKLSRYAHKCFFEDFENSNVDMKLSYTGDNDEPEALPARYPHALFNPSISGIGYGMASNIPPFNMKEVMEATIKLIKNPKEKIFIIPDSPTGADIVDDGKLEAVCRDGVGTFTLRGSVEIDEINNVITITSIPLQTTIDSIILKIVELKEKKVFDEIKEIKDYTKNKTGVRCEIHLEPNANPHKTLEKLYKKNTGLQKTYPVGMIMIDDYQSYDFGVKSFLLFWIEYRRDIIRSSYNTKLVKAMEAQNINDVLLMISNEKNGKETIRIMTQSRRSEVPQKLMDTYGINSQQANTIANMRANAFCIDAHEEYKEKKEQLIEEILMLEDILDNDDKIDEVIIEQLKEGIKLFGGPRRSKVVKDGFDEADIPDTMHILGISKDGFIKKVGIDKGQIGQIGDTHKQYMTMSLNNRDNLLVFDSTGMVSKIPVSTIPDMKLKEKGIQIDRYFKVNGDIVSVLIEPTEKELKKNGKTMLLTFLTKQGFVKRTYLSDFAHINGSMIAIKIPNTDELVAVEYTVDNTAKDMVIYTNLGNGVRRDIKEFPILKPNTRGTRHIAVNDEDEYCVGFDKINPEKKYMFYITSSGRVKITEMKYFPTMKRQDTVISLINLEKSETLVGIHTVNRNDKVVVYKKHSEPEIIDLSSIDVSTRVAKGEKVIKTPKGDAVLAYTIINK